MKKMGTQKALLLFITLACVNAPKLLASNFLSSTTPSATKVGKANETTQAASKGGPSLDRTNPNYLENDYNAPCPVGDCDTSGNNYPRHPSRDDD